MREPFGEAVAAFKKFAHDQGRPTELIWISQDRVRVAMHSVWIFRPSELTNEDHAMRFYEAAREGESSLKLLGIGELGGRYVAVVEEMPAPPQHPKMFYMSLAERPRYAIRSVTNRLVWVILGMLPALKHDRRISESISLERTTKSANKSWVATGNNVSCRVGP